MNLNNFQEAVIRNDVMVDKLIIKDVQLTAANDDNYFVFEDFILQVIQMSQIIFQICKDLE